MLSWRDVVVKHPKHSDWPEYPTVGTLYLVFMNKSIIWIGVVVGSIIGSFIPLIWHASLFSFSSVIFSGLGGIAGIWAGWKINQNYF